MQVAECTAAPTALTSSPTATPTSLAVAPLAATAQQSAAASSDLPVWAVALISVGASVCGVSLCVVAAVVCWCKHRKHSAPSVEMGARDGALDREESVDVHKELDQAFPAGEAAGAACVKLTEINIEMSGLHSPRPRLRPPPLGMSVHDGESCYVPEARNSPGSTLYLPDDIASTSNFAAPVLPTAPEEDAASLVSAAPTANTMAFSEAPTSHTFAMSA